MITSRHTYILIIIIMYSLWYFVIYTMSYTLSYIVLHYSARSARCLKPDSSWRSRIPQPPYSLRLRARTRSAAIATIAVIRSHSALRRPAVPGSSEISDVLWLVDGGFMMFSVHLCWPNLGHPNQEYYTVILLKMVCSNIHIKKLALVAALGF